MEEAPEIRVAPQGDGDGASGATAAFPYDRMTIERFREAFPRARWRDDLNAWFVPGARAERRLTAWIGREWSGVLAHADQRGRDALAFDPIYSPYLEVADGFVTYFGKSAIGLRPLSVQGRRVAPRRRERRLTIGRLFRAIACLDRLHLNADRFSLVKLVATLGPNPLPSPMHDGGAIRFPL
ncbi:hypothetical protein [Belnapia sp. F-4-1]|uniref:hypothetical protein n=1 Tax=Belnapia sp. F-4-1 TaxID=1545443 RepID=UPI001916EC3B|nr:hypothetical protein [Belnapia sp. F-4-1]